MFSTVANHKNHRNQHDDKFQSKQVSKTPPLSAIVQVNRYYRLELSQLVEPKVNIRWFKQTDQCQCLHNREINMQKGLCYFCILSCERRKYCNLEKLIHFTVIFIPLVIFKWFVAVLVVFIVTSIETTKQIYRPKHVLTLKTYQNTICLFSITDCKHKPL